MNLSLPKSVRITKAKEYTQIFQKGKHTHGKFWQIVFAPSENNKSALGLAVSKKIHKRAVDRNLYKRLARETYRKNQEKLSGINTVVMTKNHTRVDNATLIEDLESLFLQSKTKL